MIPVQTVIDGLTKYIDCEIVNNMVGYQKWVFGVGSSLFLNKGVNLVNNLKDNEIIKAMGIIDDTGIDVASIYAELKRQAQKGDISFTLPMIGKMTLNESDVDTMYRYIVE